MDCAFTYDHYKAMLDGALGAGYSFDLFDNSRIPVEQQVIFLRHDIDIDPIVALPIARIEKDLGIRSTFFVMDSCPLYSPEDAHIREALQEIASMGHKVGRHLTMQQIDRMQVRPNDKIYNTIVYSVHKPDKAIFGGSNLPTCTYDKRFFTDIAYISDSRGIWRSGCLCKHIDAKKQMQVLTHPCHWSERGIRANYVANSIADRRRVEIRKYLEDISL